MATCPLHTSVKMVVSKSLELYLHNTSTMDLQLTAGELFGFGLGSFTESPLGRTRNEIVFFFMSLMAGGVARSNAAEAWPWIIDKDSQLVVHVGAEGKKLLTVAEVCWHAAQSLGITSISLIEHTMNQKIQACLSACSLDCGHRLIWENPSPSGTTLRQKARSAR